MIDYLQTARDLKTTSEHLLWLLEQEDTTDEEAAVLLEHLYKNKEKMEHLRDQVIAKGVGFYNISEEL